MYTVKKILNCLVLTLINFAMAFILMLIAYLVVVAVMILALPFADFCLGLQLKQIVLRPENTPSYLAWPILLAFFVAFTRRDYIELRDRTRNLY